MIASSTLARWTIFNGCMSRNGKEVAVSDLGLVPYESSNLSTSTNLRRTAIMVFERRAKPWGAILSGSDSQVLRH